MVGNLELFGDFKSELKWNIPPTGLDSGGLVCGALPSRFKTL